MEKLQDTDWENITETMHKNVYPVIRNLLSDKQCEILKAEYNNPNAYQKTVVMERYRFGLGEYKYL